MMGHWVGVHQKYLRQSQDVVHLYTGLCNTSRETRWLEIEFQVCPNQSFRVQTPSETSTAVSHRSRTSALYTFVVTCHSCTGTRALLGFYAVKIQQERRSYTVRSESRCALRQPYVDLVVKICSVS